MIGGRSETRRTRYGFSRREFLAGTSMLGAATLLGLPRTAGFLNERKKELKA